MIKILFLLLCNGSITYADCIPQIVAKSCSIFSVFCSVKALQKSSSVFPSLCDTSLNHSLIFFTKDFVFPCLELPKTATCLCTSLLCQISRSKSTQRFSILLSSSSYVSSCNTSFSIHSPAIRCSISFLVLAFALSMNLRTIAFPLEFDQKSSGIAVGSLLSGLHN